MAIFVMDLQGDNRKKFR